MNYTHVHSTRVHRYLSHRRREQVPLAHVGVHAEHRPARLVLAAVLPGDFEHLHRAAAYHGTLHPRRAIKRENETNQELAGSSRVVYMAQQQPSHLFASLPKDVPFFVSASSFWHRHARPSRVRSMCFTVSCRTNAAWRGVGLTRPSKRMTRQCGVQSTVREHPTAAFDLHTARANSARPQSPPTPWTVRPTEPGKPRRSRLYLPSTEKDQINKAPYPPARATRGPSSLADLVVRPNLLLRSMLFLFTLRFLSSAPLAPILHHD